MNKTKLNFVKLLLAIIALIIIKPSTVISQPDFQGDLVFTNSSSQLIKVKIEVGESLCFEGLNQESTQNPNNRHYQIQNGTMFRKYLLTGNNSQTYEANATYNSTDIEGVLIQPGLPLIYRQNSTQIDQNVNFSYGYSKYKIIISRYYSPGTYVTTHIYYFNTADSKYMKVTEYSDYGRDVNFIYDGDNIPIRLEANGIYLQQYNIYPYNPNLPLTELKIWKICFGENQETPKSKKFYVRSTPFGMRPDKVGTYRANVYY